MQILVPTRDPLLRYHRHRAQCPVPFALYEIYEFKFLNKIKFKKEFNLINFGSCRKVINFGAAYCAFNAHSVMNGPGYSGFF